MTDTPQDRGVPDLLYGAAKIADFLGVKRNVVYHLAETGRIPVFKVGAVLCARRARILEAFEALEGRTGP